MCAAQSFHHYNRDGTMTLVKIVTAVLVVTSLPTLSNTAQADTWDSFNFIDSKPISEVWLNPGFYSYHFESDLNLNNNNLGFGAEYRYSTRHSVTAGRFNNSDRQISSYAAWNWQPVEIGSIRLGGLIGVIDGYPKTKNGEWFVIALPVASYEYKNLGINLTIVPSVKDLVYGAISLQLKLKLF